MHLIKTIDEGPHSKKPQSEPKSMTRPVNRARKDIEAILNDARDSKRPWPKVPENVQKMNSTELQKRIDELDKEEVILKQDLKKLEEEMNKEDGKKRVEIRGNMLDVNRLRRDLKEYVQMYEAANPKESGVGLTEEEVLSDTPDRLAS